MKPIQISYQYKCHIQTPNQQQLHFLCFRKIRKRKRFDLDALFFSGVQCEAKHGNQMVWPFPCLSFTIDCKCMFCSAVVQLDADLFGYYVNGNTQQKDEVLLNLKKKKVYLWQYGLTLEFNCGILSQNIERMKEQKKWQ